MKKIILSSILIGAIALLTPTFAQTGGLYKNTLKIGLSGGVAVPGNNAGGNFGVDASYQYLATGNWGIGVATGYQHFFGKEKEVGGITLNNNSFGVIPIAGLVRYYPKAEGIYVGADLGYGVITGDEEVASNNPVDRPTGGFYLRPQIGYHNVKWNVFAHYSKVFTGDEGRINIGSDHQKYNAGVIGIGFSYNIGLGYK